MLTNTVGIMLFILIFTVLATASASVIREFPLEHESNKKPIDIICAHGKIYPVSLGGLAVSTYLPNGGKDIDVGQLARKVQTEHIDMDGILAQGAFVVMFTPRPDGGEAIGKISDGSTALNDVLAGSDPEKRYFYFFVAPDSIDAFSAARKFVKSRGYEYGWGPSGQDGGAGLVLLGSVQGAFSGHPL
jgi:hypothetical protein